MSIMCCEVCGAYIDTDVDVECFDDDDGVRCVTHRKEATDENN